MGLGSDFLRRLKPPFVGRSAYIVLLLTDALAQAFVAVGEEDLSRIVAALLTVALAGCQTTARSSWDSLSPPTGRTEALAGARAAPAVEAQFGGVVSNGAAESRMLRIGRRITRSVPELRGPYRYLVLDSDRVDAVSLPGGRIYVTRALYERLSRDDLLAAALAHEMAHLQAKDHFKPRPASPHGALDKELSADRFAARWLDAAGFPSEAMTDLNRLVADAQPAGWARVRIAHLTRPSMPADNQVNHDPNG